MDAKPPEEKFRNDHRLLDRFANSDSKILLYLYNTYLPGVVKYVCRNGGNEEDARDVFQEALMALYKQVKAGNLRLTASLQTYIFSICRYQWLKTIRKNKRIEQLVEGFEWIDLNSDIVGKIEKAERFTLLKSHLSKMSVSSQKILDLHFQKYSTDEIAQSLGLSKLYVKKKKYECKKELIESIRGDSRFKELIVDLKGNLP